MGATRVAACGCEKRRISIHAPAWGATRQLNRDTQRYSFQSTPPPAWGATRKPFEIETERIYFNPRPPHGERPGFLECSRFSSKFQSTPPHGERPIRNFPKGPAMIFQSTLPHGERLTGKGVGSITISISIHAPAWRATLHHGHGLHGNQISIHAPAWGATKNRNPSNRKKKYFNPRPPHGERPALYISGERREQFQSTPPAWGATIIGQSILHYMRISIHAPRMGSDSVFDIRRSITFNISIHAPRMGSDNRGRASKSTRACISIHAPAWGATRPPRPVKAKIRERREGF